MLNRDREVDVVIAAGGTGGHVFPAQALAGRLREKNWRVHFMAKGLTANPYFQNSGFSFADISAAGVSKNPFQMMKGSYAMTRGLIESLYYLKRLKPSLVVGFGSYHTAPVLAAAALLSVPIVLHESNSCPGKVNRLFSRRALFTGIFFDSVAGKLRGNVEPVNYPLRKEFQSEALVSKDEALSFYQLEQDRKTCLVFGGSQGASALNRMMCECASQFLCEKLQIIHITGGHIGGSAEKEVKGAYDRAGIPSFVASFEKWMPRAYAAADFAICRSGAGTIAELIHFSLPAIFIPFPHAVDDHQRLNAEYISDSVGGGLCLLERGLTKEALITSIGDFAKDTTLKKMKSRLQEYRDLQPRKEFEECVLQALENYQSTATRDRP